MTYSIFDAFDRQRGNGSRERSDDWLDEKSIFNNEWGSTAATTFDPDGPDGKGNEMTAEKRKKFERLYERNNGKGASSRRGDIRSSHVKNDAKMFMSALDMPSRQRERVLNILDGLDISSNTFGPRKYEKILLALCSLVADEALSRKEEPMIEERLFLSDNFRHCMDVTSMSSSELRQIRKRIREETNEFGE
jgi:hypothetical protein